MPFVLDFSECPYFWKEDDKLNILPKVPAAATYYVANPILFLFFLFFFHPHQFYPREICRARPIRCNAFRPRYLRKSTLPIQPGQNWKVKSRPALPFSCFVLLLGHLWNSGISNWDSPSKWFWFRGVGLKQKEAVLGWMKQPACVESKATSPTIISPNRRIWTPPPPTITAWSQSERMNKTRPLKRPPDTVDRSPSSLPSSASPCRQHTCNAVQVMHTCTPTARRAESQLSPPRPLL